MYISSVCFSFLIVFSFFLPFLKVKKIYLFIYYCWLHWVFSAGCRLSLVAAGRGYSLVVLHKPLLKVASLVAYHGLQSKWAQQFQHTGSVVAACGLSSCGTWLSCSMHVEYSRTKDQTCVPCIGRQILNHWTTRAVLSSFFNQPCLEYLFYYWKNQ